ncbi:hypothetical protein [Flavobacterium sp. NRK1]|uniref:hypothetical protein n=1 Tax=Flavobacterium sp. NRK1 TaxID=2954929 RepID=UPI002092B615|nr:hypothetical protein [Flavobacterium sp. NRK1]MCO6147124.1 hypothetical protein [Flavobacterium sp. NRK1]
MKNILIPTTLQQDSLFSVKAAIKQAADSKCIITLILLSDAPDMESASYYLRKAKYRISKGQQDVLNNCRKEIDTTENCILDIHYQFGLSAPLLKNLLEHLSTNLIIIPASYKMELNKIHRYFLNYISNNKIPILHLTDTSEEQEFNKALYLENKKTLLDVHEVHKMVNTQFRFKIVSHAAINDNNEELVPQLEEAISKNNIDLVIETRRPTKLCSKKNSGITVNNTLGLPVLSLYEEISI